MITLGFPLCAYLSHTPVSKQAVAYTASAADSSLKYEATSKTCSLSLQGMTAFHWACGSDVSIVKLLKAHGADLEKPSLLSVRFFCIIAEAKLEPQHFLHLLLLVFQVLLARFCSFTARTVFSMHYHTHCYTGAQTSQLCM